MDVVIGEQVRRVLGADEPTQVGERTRRLIDQCLRHDPDFECAACGQPGNGRNLRIIELDKSGTPTAIIDPAATDADRLRVSRLVASVLGAFHRGDSDGIAAAMRSVLSLSFEDRVTLAWELALSLGVHAGRWLRPSR